MIKNVLVPLLISLVSIGGFSAETSLDETSVERSTKVVTRAGETPTETEIDNTDLSVKITQNSVTEQTQFYKFSFSVGAKVYYSNRYTSCELTVTDPNFSDDFSSSVCPNYASELYSIKAVSGDGTVIIPSTAKYSSYFTFDVKSISKYCIQADLTGFNRKITRVIIPENIENIDADAFKGINADAQFYLVAASEPAGFESGWNQGLTVNYSYTYTNAEQKEAIGSSFTSERNVNNGHQFVLGAYDNSFEGGYSPLRLEYTVSKSDGSTESRTNDFVLDSAHTLFNGIGTLPPNKEAAVKKNLGEEVPPVEGSIAGGDTVELSIVIDLNEGESIVDNSLIVRNIHGFSGNTSKPIEGLTESFFRKNIKTSNKLSFNQFMLVSPHRISNYGKYTQLEVNIDEVPGIYKTVNPVVYENNRAKIESGECTIRYRFTSLYDTRFIIDYKNSNGEVVSKRIYIAAPDGYNFINLSKESNNKVGFLIDHKLVGDDFKGSKILKVQMESFHITLDVFSNKTHSPISTANVELKFGRTTLYDSSKDNIKINNLNLVIGVVVGVAVILFAAGAVTLFFVFKNIFKNDEFRRLNPKRFLKKAITYFIGYMLIVLSLLFIIIRWGFLESTIVVFNPADVFVIMFTIAGAIALGLFIKDLVVAIKQSHERKVSSKLKLDSLEVDDGTK